MARSYSNPMDRAKDILSSLPIEQRKEAEEWLNNKIRNKHNVESTVSVLYSVSKIYNLLNGKTFKGKNKAKTKDYGKILDSGLDSTFYRKLIKRLGDKKETEQIEAINRKEKVIERRPITDEEKNILLNSLINQRDRCIIKMLMEYPIRCKELGDIDVGDCEFEESGVRVILGKNGKTKNSRRTAFFMNCAIDLRLYYENHPSKDQKDKPFFYQFSSNRFGQRIKGWVLVKSILKDISKRTGLRKIRPHDFRGDTATNYLIGQNRDGNTYSMPEVMVMGGWSSLKTIDRYSRATSEQVVEKRKNGNKMKRNFQEHITPIECPRCNKQTPKEFKNCINCGLPQSQFQEEAKNKLWSLLLPKLIEKHGDKLIDDAEQIVGKSEEAKSIIKELLKVENKT